MFCCIPVSGQPIITKFCTCHDSYAAMACAKFCNDNVITFWLRIKLNLISNLNIVWRFISGIALWLTWLRPLWLCKLTKWPAWVPQPRWGCPPGLLNLAGHWFLPFELSSTFWTVQDTGLGQCDTVWHRQAPVRWYHSGTSLSYWLS